jgi:hypothetical protein
MESIGTVQRWHADAVCANAVMITSDTLTEHFEYTDAVQLQLK